MKNKTPNAALVWKQFEDYLVPQLRFSTTDRAVYSYLVRHSRLEGKLRLRFSMAWLARGARVCDGAARPAVRRLVDHGVLRLVERTKAGHVVDVRLPDEIPALRPILLNARNPAPQTAPTDLEQLDFWKTPALRQAIHARERGRCFYCLRPTPARKQCIDHVVPRVQSGRNSYRNLVSCCMECNSLKCEHSASDLLCRLYRDARLTAAQLSNRLRALDALASGSLRPPSL
jgi:5-methylcytosine-specific restriction endonuclease McrA